MTISAIDRGNDSDKVGLVIAYKIFNPEHKILISNGKQYKHKDIILPGELPSENVLYYCTPIIKVMKGWKNNPISKETKELPIEVKQFLSEIESRTGAKIISIGVGQNREDLLYLD